MITGQREHTTVRSFFSEPGHPDPSQS